MTPLGPFDAFAAALRARHRRRGGTVPALEARVLLVPRAGDASWHLHVAGTQINVAPRIALTVAAPPVAQHAPASPSVAATAPVVLARLRHCASTVRVREALTLVQHTHTRGVRIEPGSAPAVGMPAPVPAAQEWLVAPAPVLATPAASPMIVARQAPFTPTATALAALEPARSARRAAVPPAPSVAQTIDVERITDSVLGALDRRVIAHRERYGNI